MAFDHAYHGRTNLTMALTAKTMPYKSGFGPFAPEVYRAPMSYPFRDRPGSIRRARPRERAIDADREAGRRDQPGGDHHRADPGRGRVHRARRRASCPTLAEWATANGVVFIADEVQTGFARTGAWFACEHEGIVPDLDHARPRASPAACRSPRSPAAPRSWTPSHAGGLGGTYGGNPRRLRRGARGDRDRCASWTWPARARAIEATVLSRGSRRWRTRPADRRRARTRRHDRHRAGRARRPASRTPTLTRAVAAGVPRAGRRRADLRHVRQRHPLAAAAGHPRRPARRGPRRRSRTRCARSA